MTDIRFVTGHLDVVLASVDSESEEKFELEYRALSDFEEDAVGQWLKLARARGETQESDDVLLTLLVELHKKVDQLTSLVKNEEKTLLELPINTQVVGLGFEHLKFQDAVLKEGNRYYCRIDMPVFPKREMPLYLEVLTPQIAKIVRINDKDQKDWNAYVTSRERIMIREMKAGN